MKLKNIFIMIFIAILSTGCFNGNVDTEEMPEATANGATTEANEVQAPKKENVTIAIENEPETGFDPCTGWGRYGSPLIQSTLVETDVNMDIVPDLATSYTVSEDGLVWTFEIRDDAYFTDGEKVTANDVAFTYNQAKNSNSIVDLTVMESCEAVDENTAVFTLKSPDITFIYTVAGTGIVPEHAYDADYAENPIGSGPYQFVQWDKGQQVILKANENYYGKIPEIKNVNILFMEEGAAFAAAKAGKVDVATTSPGVATTEIEGMTLVPVKTVDNRGVTLPTVKNTGETTPEGYPIGNDVTSDIAIRKALSYGLDRDKLVADILNGYGHPAYTECDNMPWYNPEAAVAYDKEKATQILDDGSWILNVEGIREKDGIKAEFNLIYPADDMTRQALAIGFSQQALELGIKVNVEGLGWAEIDQRMFSDAVLMGWGAQNPMESYLLYHSKYKGGTDYYNPENFDNPTVDKHLDDAITSGTLDEAYGNFKLAQWDGETGTSTLGDCPWVWLVNIDHLYYIRDGLDIGTQKLHPHGHSWPLLANLKEWKWTE